jgi:hypothetical protein
LKVISDQNVQRLFYDELLSYDIDDFDWENERPLTQFYLNLQSNSRSHEVQFMINFFEEKLENEDPNWVETDFDQLPFKSPFEISTEDLTDLCICSTKKYFAKYETNPIRFGMDLGSMNILNLERGKLKEKRSFRFSLQCMKNWLISNSYIIANPKSKTKCLIQSSINHLSDD